MTGLFLHVASASSIALPSNQRTGASADSSGQALREIAVRDLAEPTQIDSHRYSRLAFSLIRPGAATNPNRSCEKRRVALIGQTKQDDRL